MYPICIFVSHLFLVSDLLSFLCRGSKDKCSVTIADLVLLYNKEQEGITKPDCLAFHINNGIADVKSHWLKYCKPYEQRLSLLVLTFGVIPVVEDESTEVMVSRFILEAKAAGKAKKTGSVKLLVVCLLTDTQLWMCLLASFLQ